MSHDVISRSKSEISAIENHWYLVRSVVARKSLQVEISIRHEGCSGLHEVTERTTRNKKYLFLSRPAIDKTKK